MNRDLRVDADLTILEILLARKQELKIELQQAKLQLITAKVKVDELHNRIEFLFTFGDNVNEWQKILVTQLKIVSDLELELTNLKAEQKRTQRSIMQLKDEIKTMLKLKGLK